MICLPQKQSKSSGIGSSIYEVSEIESSDNFCASCLGIWNIKNNK